MSPVLILYASQYGYTETYASWLAADLKQAGIDSTVSSLGQVSTTDILAADAVVVGASDYGGFLTGAAEVKKLSDHLSTKPLVFFTVSFSGLDGAEKEKLDSMVVKNFGSLAKNQKIFHLRGGIDHRRLSLKHKTVMVGIRTAIAAVPNKSISNQQMLDSFEQRTVDYSDRSSLLPVIEAIKKTLAA